RLPPPCHVPTPTCHRPNACPRPGSPCTTTCPRTPGPPASSSMANSSPTRASWSPGPWSPPSRPTASAATTPSAPTGPCSTSCSPTCSPAILWATATYLEKPTSIGPCAASSPASADQGLQPRYDVGHRDDGVDLEGAGGAE